MKLKRVSRKLSKNKSTGGFYKNKKSLNGLKSLPNIKKQFRKFLKIGKSKIT